MPTWLPSFDNGALSALALFVCTLIGWYVRAMLPLWKDTEVEKKLAARKAGEMADTLRIAIPGIAHTLAQQAEKIDELHDYFLPIKRPQIHIPPPEDAV